MNKTKKLEELQNKIHQFADDKKSLALIKEKQDFFATIKPAIIEAINNSQYQVLYQPHIHTKTHVIRGAEALFRLWATIDDTKIEIKPYVLFLLAHHFNFEQQLVTKAFQTVATDTLTLKKQINNNFITSFNLNPSLFNNNLLSDFVQIANSTKLSTQNIAIELVEHSGLNDITEAMLQNYKKHGFRIYLDDFGTAYATPDKLNLPFDVVKFGGQIMTSIDQNPQHQTLIKSAADYCKQKGIATIAEHIETPAELEFVKKCNIDYVQGYIFDKPLTFDQLISKYAPFKQS